MQTMCGGEKLPPHQQNKSMPVDVRPVAKIGKWKLIRMNK